ncbi:MAG: peptide chain release factor N(5)-glutamine methyltransferase [Planctomycetota bacterium]
MQRDRVYFERDHYRLFMDENGIMAVDKKEKEWTLLDLLNWTTQYFEGKGIDDARLNAEILLSEVMEMERVMLYARFENTVPAEKRRAFRRLVSKRADHQPLQYLLGSAEFYGRQFDVNPAVLVPRQETELVVDKCLEKIPAEMQDFMAVDIGTGSGVIGLTLACERKGIDVIATDTSGEALDVARSNAHVLGVDDRVDFYEGKLCDPLMGQEADIELIASNPPYIPTGEIDDLQPEVSEWEPREALDGGEDGLDAIRELVPRAADFLAAGGWLILEIGESQAEDVRGFVADEDDLDGKSVETVSDDNCVRVMAVRKKSS